jgi:hypothetical protein
MQINNINATLADAARLSDSAYAGYMMADVYLSIIALSPAAQADGELIMRHARSDDERRDGIRQLARKYANLGQ